MRSLGIMTRPNEYYLSLLAGTEESPNRPHQAPPKKQRYPSAADESDQLLQLKRCFDALLRDYEVEKVILVEAVGGRQRGPSSFRLKAECAIQLAAREAELPVLLVNPTAVSAAEKRMQRLVRAPLEEAINDGRPITPADLRKAVVAAWMGLP